MKRGTILPGALQPSSVLSKTSDKSDKTSFEGSPGRVLSFLSSILRRSKSRLRDDVRRSTVDSGAKPERPMSRAEATE